MMCARFFILIFLAIMRTYAQPLPGTAEMVTCGKVEIPPMTPTQVWTSPLSWSLPGQIAASNCYTGFLQGSHQALNAMYNAMYTASAPSAGSNPTGTTGALSSRSKKKDNGKSKKESNKEPNKKESNKKTKDRKEAEGKKKQ